MKKSVAFTCLGALLVLSIVLRGECQDEGDLEYRVEFWQDAAQRGTKEERLIKVSELGQCLELRPDTVSSMKWPSDDIALLVYDGMDCGGNRMAFYSGSLHKKVQPSGFTRDEGFLAGRIDDLRTVCKFDSCGYSSTAFSPGFIRYVKDPPMLTGKLIQPCVLSSNKCNCTDSWDDSIKTFRVLLTWHGALKRENHLLRSRERTTRITSPTVDDF